MEEKNIEVIQKEIEAIKEAQSMLYFEVDFLKQMELKNQSSFTKKEIFEMIDIAERNALSELQLFKAKDQYR